jgi:hypothetical protein
MTLTSISPLSGPPGTAITCLGSGFTAASQVGCPTLVPTTFVDAGTLTAQIPWNLDGPAGGAMQVVVYVQNADGTLSQPLLFTVQFPADRLQTWTTIDQVTGEVPGFQRGGRITDQQIQTWMRSTAQEIAAEMMRRGLSLDPTTWQQPASAAEPEPVGVLEMINRMGAAARLAGAIGAQFSGTGEWGVSKSLAAAYARGLAALRSGDYDKYFLPGAATVDPSPQLGASTGGHPTFTKEKVF